MEANKRKFDLEASRLSLDSDVVIGMPGACLQTFTSTNARMRVFHEVDAHPVARNAALKAAYGKAAAAEMASDLQIERIESELEAADLILTPSALVSRQMSANGVPSGKVLEVPYGVDLTAFRPTRTDDRRAKRPRLIYVGQISYRKGVPFLLDAVKTLSIDLTMVGPVIAKELLVGMPSNVQHVATMSQASLNVALNGADAFVIASVEDNFALVVLEALAAGLPVISTDGVGASDLLTGDLGVVVPAGSVQHLRSAMSEVDVLTAEARTTRSAAFRSRIGSDPVLNSWESYSTRVISGIVAKQAGHRKE
ncbi:glycosyltransferase family 4 protein [Herbiconiux solani]|uniref:glycosyltransferase family 4 protein n=1 Tax=Herbiconiux solani TaxID=661329 RepID=UPI0012ECC137|nr:glycosyltransferase family 4 protein [Herbiconiux solani]